MRMTAFAPGTDRVAGEPAPRAGRIGPNAVTRLSEALDEVLGEPAASEVFGAAGQLAYRQAPPSSMVDERVVTALHVALRDVLTPADAARIARRAGVLTGEYLLAHRIPAPVRWLLPALPKAWSSRLLVEAMARHAWTFAGSGRFAAVRPARDRAPGDSRRIPPAARLQLEIADCPVCRGDCSTAPVCDYYAATFEHLFRALVSPRTTVVECECRAAGAVACRFDVRW